MADALQRSLMFSLTCQVLTLSGPFDFSVRPSQASAAVTFSSPHTMSLSRLNKQVSAERRSQLDQAKPWGEKEEGEQESRGKELAGKPRR